jgi:serine protease inhibitor
VVAAFEEGEFDNIVEDARLRISAINHAASIDVTVDGTVGAAATGNLS